jgi:hypothetical protein
MKVGRVGMVAKVEKRWRMGFYGKKELKVTHGNFYVDASLPQQSAPL